MLDTASLTMHAVRMYPNNVRQIREAKTPELSRERLARLADVSTSTVMRLERGDDIGLAKARRIAAALEVSLDDLFGEAS